MRLVLASKNQHKLVELQTILGQMGLEVVLESEIGIDVDVEETGTTFAENAMLKAKAVMEASGMAAIADDSGLVVDALNGEPGVYSARYGGRPTDLDRTLLLLEKMKDVPEDARTGRFVSAIACALPDGTEVTAEGTCEGKILFDLRGTGGFGYDPVFYVPELGKTFAEAGAEEKNAISHRGNALRAFCEAWKERGLC
ncbi:MAG: XTP/dITP diphosphatase [Oscillospiraceae bacterium]|nr:XTP/dITP diphosphatase [Oscillospiraceae bacterium]